MCLLMKKRQHLWSVLTTTKNPTHKWASLKSKLPKRKKKKQSQPPGDIAHRMKDKDHTTIAINAQYLTKSNILSCQKNTQQTRNRRKLSQHNKKPCTKHLCHSWRHAQWWKTEGFSLRMGQMPTLASSIEQSADHLSQSNLDRKKAFKLERKK